MLKKWLIFGISILISMTACHYPLYNQTLNNVSDVKLKMQAAKRTMDTKAKGAPSLIIKKGMYVDTTPINLTKSPSWLQNYVVIRGDRLPFSYYSRLLSTAAGGNVLTKYQPGLDPSMAVTISYAGPLKGALDLLASKAGLVYSIRGNSIFWQAFITRTFDVAFMPGASDYLMGRRTGGGSTANQNSGSTVQNFVAGDPSEDEYSNLSAKLSVWTDLENTIKSLLSPEGQVTVSQASTSVTVRDRPANVELVGQYINNLNKTLSKQVLIKVQVLEVSLENSFNFGIDWRLIVRAFHNSPFVINGNYGSPVTITSFVPQANATTTASGSPTFGFDSASNPINPGQLPSDAIPAYTILLNALSQQGHTSVVSEPRTVCLNNQVCVIQIVTQKGYIAKLQNTTLAGGNASNANNTVTSEITPGNLITGFTLYVLPKIYKDKIYLQINADLSTDNGFTNAGTTGTGSTVNIQLPNISVKHFNQRSVIRSGDMMVLSGLKQLQNVSRATQFIQAQSLGGKGAQQTNSETIVLITPYILDGNA